MLDQKDILSPYKGTTIVSLDPYINSKIKRLKKNYKNIIIPNIVVNKIYVQYFNEFDMVFIIYHQKSNISLIHSLILNISIEQPIRIEKQLASNEFINSLLANYRFNLENILIF